MCAGSGCVVAVVVTGAVRVCVRAAFLCITAARFCSSKSRLLTSSFGRNIGGVWYTFGALGGGVKTMWSCEGESTSAVRERPEEPVGLAGPLRKGAGGS